MPGGSVSLGFWKTAPFGTLLNGSDITAIPYGGVSTIATTLARISDLELRLEDGTPSLLLKARTLPRKAGHDGIEGYSWPVLVVR